MTTRLWGILWFVKPRFKGAVSIWNFTKIPSSWGNCPALLLRPQGLEILSYDSHIEGCFIYRLYIDYIHSKLINCYILLTKYLTMLPSKQCTNQLQLKIKNKYVNYWPWSLDKYNSCYDRYCHHSAKIKGYITNL